MTKAFSVRELVKKYPEFTLGPLSLDLEPGMVRQAVVDRRTAHTAGLYGSVSTWPIGPAISRFSRGRASQLGSVLLARIP
jgi:hypothetical protein